MFQRRGLSLQLKGACAVAVHHQREKFARQEQELEKSKKATVVRAEQIKEGDNRESEQVKKDTEMTCYLGSPDVDFAKLAAAFGVKGETVTAPDQLKAAITRAIESTREGRPYLIDAVVARSGAGADSVWYPRYSVAAGRTKKV